MTNKTNNLLTIPQAAKIYGCKHPYLYAEIKRGHLSVTEISGVKFIKRSVLDKFMRRQKLHAKSIDIDKK